MPACKKCGVKINRPYQYCDECNDEIAISQGQLLRRGRVILKQLHEEADASGSPKVYRAGECSQEFLKSLIPRS